METERETPTTSPIVLRGLVELAEAARVPPAMYTPMRDALDDADGLLVVTDAEQTFWEKAAADPNLRDLAVVGPPLTPKGAFDVVELLATTAPDVRRALSALATASDLLHGVAIYELVQRDDASGAFVYRSPHARDTDAGAMAAEVALTTVVEIVRRATGTPEAAPRAMLLRGGPHARLGSLASALACPVHTDAATDRLELEAAFLDLPLRTADARVHGIALRLSELERARIRAASTTLATRAALRQLVVEPPPGLTQLEALAQALELRPRTLQARLAREGVQLRALVDDARRLAAEHLLLAERSPGAVQRALGYGDAGSFRRACRRWWGSGPLARRLLLERLGGRERARPARTTSEMPAGSEARRP